MLKHRTYIFLAASVGTVEAKNKALIEMFKKNILVDEATKSLVVRGSKMFVPRKRTGISLSKKNSHIESRGTRGRDVMKRLDEMNKGYLPNDNWATDEDIKKDSKGNFKESSRNKFFE